MGRLPSFTEILYKRLVQDQSEKRTFPLTTHPGFTHAHPGGREGAAKSLDSCLYSHINM